MSDETITGAMKIEPPRVPRQSMMCLCGCRHEILGYADQTSGWIRCFCGVRWDVRIGDAVIINQRKRKNRK